MIKDKVAITFCTSCCNRLWQLKKVLASNLKAIEGTTHNICLVDYGSTDGMADWVWFNFKTQIDLERLRFFQVTNQVSWNISKAKNLAHRLATGNFLFSLDADNFVTKNDIYGIEKVAAEGFAVHQFSGNTVDGTHGRIGISRELFHQIGGYDESLLPMGYQDIDLLNRIRLSKKPIIQLGHPEIKPIQNNMNEKIIGCKGNLKINTIEKELFSLDSLKKMIKKFIIKYNEDEGIYWAMNKLNSRNSATKIAIEGPTRLSNFSSYRGLLNNQAITIDGFDDIFINP